mgnify:CR=1 FL=1
MEPNLSELSTEQQYGTTMFIIYNVLPLPVRHAHFARFMVHPIVYMLRPHEKTSIKVKSNDYSREMVKLIGVNKQGLPGLQSEHALIDMNLSDGFQIEGQHESVMRSILQRLLLQAFTLPADEHKHVG